MLFDLCGVLRCLNIILQHPLYFILHGFLCILIEMHSHTIHCALYHLPECYRCVCSPFVLTPDKEVPLYFRQRTTTIDTLKLSNLISYSSIFTFILFPFSTDAPQRGRGKYELVCGYVVAKHKLKKTVNLGAAPCFQCSQGSEVR